MEIRTLLTKRLERGKVDFSLWVEQAENVSVMPSINVAVMQNYIEQMKNAAQTTGIPMPENPMEMVMRMPEVISHKEVYEFTEEEWAVAMEAINKALDEMVDFRRQEGEALAIKFSGNIERISQLLASVEPYEKERVEKILTRIMDALENQLDV